MDISSSLNPHVSQESPAPVPPGIEFNPSDEDIINFYLYRKIMGHNLPPGFVLDIDLYGEKNPWEIWDDINREYPMAQKLFSDDRYFFTQLKKKNGKANSKRIDRKVGVGSWEGEDAGKDVIAVRVGSDGKKRQECIGYKKRFRFEKSGTKHDGGWIMHEYSLNQSLLSHDAPQDDVYVLCRIRKKDSEKTQKKNLKRDARGSIKEVSGLKEKDKSEAIASTSSEATEDDMLVGSSLDSGNVVDNNEVKEMVVDDQKGEQHCTIPAVPKKEQSSNSFYLFGSLIDYPKGFSP